MNDKKPVFYSTFCNIGKFASFDHFEDFYQHRFNQSNQGLDGWNSVNWHRLASLHGKVNVFIKWQLHFVSRVLLQPSHDTQAYRENLTNTLQRFRLS